MSKRTLAPAPGSVNTFGIRGASVAEGANAREHHRHAVFIADLNGLFVAAAARLDDGGDAGAAGGLDGVVAGEGEEGVRGEDGALRALARSLDRQLDGFDAVGLAAADAHRGPIVGDDDGVGLDVLDTGPGEAEVGQLRGGRRALGD